MCFITMVPILINKDVFEPSYNDSHYKNYKVIKFTVWDSNYICNNLVEYLKFTFVNGIKHDMIYVLKRKIAIQFHVLVVAVAAVSMLGL